MTHQVALDSVRNDKQATKTVST